MFRRKFKRPDMMRFGFATLLLAGLAACGQEAGDAPSQSATPVADQATEAVAEQVEAGVRADSLRRRIAELSDDAFQGRAPATGGGERTREYLIAEMQKIGLAPGNGDSYEQAVPLVAITLDPARSDFSIDGETLEYGPSAMYWTKRVENHVELAESELVFVGYGVVAPEYGWNDYEGLDVAGKTVVMLVNDPGFATEDPNLFNGRAMTYYGRWTYKYEEAARQGAAGAIVIHQTAPAAYGWGVVEGSWSGPQLDLKRPDGGAGRVALEGWIQEAVARDLFAKAGLDFDAVTERAKSADFEPLPLGGLKASGKITNQIQESESANVAGVLPGAVRPDEYVLYMAHWDHLGVTFGGEDTISNGAVDNATGTAGILSIAERFAANETPPERSLMFVAVTAEESGLLGSAYFGEDPLVPFRDIVGGLNIDALMPTPSTKDIVVIGYGASELEDSLKAVAEANGMYLRPDAQPEHGYFYRSDHISLAKKGVPMLYADNGIDFVEGGEDAGKAMEADYRANRYHKPADEYWESWDLTGMTELLDILYEVGADMAYSDHWPNWYEGNEFRALRDAQRAGG